MARTKNIRFARLEDAKPMAECLRYQDYLEITEGFGHKRSIESLLKESIQKSPLSYAYVVEGRVIALGGCYYDYKLQHQGGVPWFVCSEEFVENHRRLFLTKAPELVARFLKRYRRLSNFVHADNAVAIRWLQWLGFTVHKAEGARFYHFTKEL